MDQNKLFTFAESIEVAYLKTLEKALTIGYFTNVKL